MLDLPRAGIRFPSMACVLWALVILAVGCDPEGPGASGTISIGKNVKRDGLTVLRLRAIPRPRADFDPKAPKFPGENGENLGTTLQIDPQETSVHYEFGEGIGTTPHHRWRLFAWLERGSDDELDSESTRPAPGAPYGEADFAVDSCGAGYGDYCGHTGGVDLNIDKVAP